MVYSLRSIAKGSAIYTLGQVLTKGSTFLLIPLYTHFLTPDEYGIVGYLQFILQIFFTSLMFGLYGAQTRFYYEHKDDFRTIGGFLFSINVWLISVILFFITIFLFFGDSIYDAMGPDNLPFYPYMPLIAWVSVFQAMNQLVISFWLAKKEYTKTTLLQIMQVILITGFTIYFIAILKRSAEGYFEGLLCGQGAFFVIAYPSYCKNFRFKFAWSHIAYGLGFGIPVVIHLLAGTMHTSIDRAILASRVPMAELGLYTLGYQVGMAMYLVTMSVNNVWIPSYYELMESNVTNKAHQIGRTYDIWLVCITMACIGGVLWGGDILMQLTPKQYYGAAKIIPLIFLGYYFHAIYLFAVAPIFFYKKTRLLPVFTVSAAGINVVFNLLFIPVIGILGAALATTLSMLFQATGVYLFSLRINENGIRCLPTGHLYPDHCSFGRCPIVL